MKIITMYLPQFHNVEENNRWWGEGYTEWTAVKQAESLFNKHNQPKIPLNSYYYDLLDKKTMAWQVDLMRKYGIDGACFYHYWFKNGKLLLEKPAEQLLSWKDVDMPFCFSWANAAWGRSWSKIRSAETWAPKFEENSSEFRGGVLVQQDYGNENQWKEHFNYLLPFFVDRRYIRQEQKPVFMIYAPKLIPCLKDMVDKWDQWAKEAGLEGIYFIGAHCSSYEKNILDAVLCHEPAHLLGEVKGLRASKKEPYKVDYDEAWEYLLNYMGESEKTYYGGFVAYDDTPRRGKDGIVVCNSTPNKFKYYFSELMAKNYVENRELVFLNAWNEWGEGMYLEPDEINKYGFLEAVLYAKEHYIDYIEKYRKKQSEQYAWNEYNLLQQKSHKYLGDLKILDRWLILKEKGIMLTELFEKKGIKNIAVYGMGILGKHLLRELDQSSVKVKYCIDKNADAISASYPLVSLDKEMQPVDAVIVTITNEFRTITDLLREKGLNNCISLEEIIFEWE